MFKKIMLTVLVVIILVCLVQFVKESILNNPQKIYNRIFPKYKYLAGLPVKERVYSPERKLVFTLHLMNLFPLGKAEMSVEEADDYILLKAVAKISEFVKRIYKVEAQVQSVIDKDRLYPLKYTEIVSLPDREKVKEIIYDQDNHIAQRGDKKYKIPPLTFGPASAFYYLQVQDLELGKKYEMNLVSKEDVYLFEMEAVEEKNNIFKLKGRVKRRSSSTTHGTEFTLWISEDLRIPLLFKVSTEAGSLTGRVTVEE